MSTEAETTYQSVEELIEQMEAVREQNEQLQERVDHLEENYQTLQSEHDRVTNVIQQFQAGVIGRRTFMKLVGGAAVTGALVGRATAHPASPSWGSASGTLGKESDPWNRGYVKDLHTKTVQTDSLGNDGSDVPIDDNLDLQGNQNVKNAKSIETEGLNIADDWQVARDSDDLKKLISPHRKIYLLSKEYQIDTIDATCVIVGTQPLRTTSSQGCRLSTDTSSQITISKRATVRDVQLTDDVDVSAGFGTAFRTCVFGGTVTFQGTNRATVIGCNEGTIALDSNTEKCAVTSNTNVSVTDSGTNNAVANNT
jgi:hypothetical protein